MTLDEIEQQHFTRVPISELITEIERIYEISLPDTDIRARASYLMGVYYEQKDREKAEHYYANAQRMATKLKNKRLLSDMQHYEATEAFRSGDLREVNRLEQKALALATEVGHPHRICFSYYMLGTVALNYGIQESGIDYLNQALHVSKDSGLLKLQIRLFSTLAELHLTSQNPLKSRNYAKEVIRVARELSMDIEILDSTIRLATVELELKKYGEVTKLIAEVRKTLPKENHSLWCVTHTLMGKVHEAKRRYDKAEAEFRTALALADYVNAERVRSNVHVHLAELYLKLKKPREALAESLEAVADAEKAQDIYVRKEALRCMHDCYKALGEYKEAHDYLEQYNALVAESDTALLKNRMEYHALKSDYEKEKAMSDEKTRQSELLRISMEQKERELSNSTLQLLAQTELLSDLRGDLLQIARKIPQAEPAARELRERVKNLPCQSIDWEKFDVQFKAAHPEFVKTLLERFPELTPMETRVCTLLQLNLKSHEIAKMFCLEERSIETHRFNIRKKLKLETKQSLSNFLNAL